MDFDLSRRKAVSFNAFYFENEKTAGNHYSIKETFEHIAQINLWGSSESLSGAGSTNRETLTLRKNLQELLHSIDAKILLDAPCGDFSWLSQLDLPIKSYIGVDILKNMIQKHQITFNSPVITCPSAPTSRSIPPTPRSIPPTSRGLSAGSMILSTSLDPADKPRDVGDKLRNVEDKPWDVGDKPREVVEDQPRDVGDQLRGVDILDCGEQSRFFHTFQYADITWDPLPKADIIFCRDTLVHFSFDHLMKTLINFQKTGATFLLTTTFTETQKNIDIVTGDWRPINLEKAPFNFSKPEALIIEGCQQNDNLYADKSLGLWRLNSLLL